MAAPAPSTRQAKDEPSGQAANRSPALLKDVKNMNTKQALEIVQHALENPVSTWLDYTPKNVPIVLYDDNEFVFINHPNPPKERPDNLTAATVLEINGLLTATIPLKRCDDELSLVPLVYHECFHVYQGQKFQYDGEYDFFEVLAFYPEMNPAYRALCSAETDVFNNSALANLDKAKILSATAQKRRQILAEHAGLLDFENNLERNEGLASFVEQKAKLQWFNISPDNSACYYSYSRQYFMGAATCWLFEQMYSSKEWQEKVERGMSLFELLAQSAAQEPDLSLLHLEHRESMEKQKVEQILSDANRKIENLFQNGAITIKLPSKINVFRSFSPRSIISLGDGRLIHPEFVIIQTPNGSISVESEMILENYNDDTVTFSSKPYKVIDEKLVIDTENVRVSLENVRQSSAGIVEVFEIQKAG